ncbi:MAG: hypothetical protein R3246_04710 [Acidimicrobiia bacterium]|nr:hypothetical protein [Acidimicrobiia bacterium]
MRLIERLNGGFGVSARVAGYAPTAALVLAVPGVAAFVAPGDWRTSVVPWFFAAIPACFAVTCLGLVRLHRSRWVTVGGAWTALAMLGISGFFLAVGIGGLTGLQDLPEDQLGLLAWLPIISFGFGFLSMTPALAVTAWATQRADVVPRWGVWTLWLLAPLLAVIFIVGGNGPAPFDELAAPVGLSVIMLGWVVIGQALLRAHDARTGLDSVPADHDVSVDVG